MMSILSRVIVVFGLLVATIGLAIIGGYVGMFLSGAIGCMLIYTFVMSLWISRGDIHAERIIHKRTIQPGDQVEVTMTISVPVRYWLCWIVVEERWVQLKNGHILKEQANQTELTEHYACLAYIQGARDIKCQYTTSAKARGQYGVHSSRVTIGDMFGLVNRVLTQEEHDAEIVHVNPVPLAGSWYKRVHDMKDSPADYGTLRDYMSGDPISSIDWKSYARYQALKTKQLEVEEHTSHLIVMDAREAHFERIVSAVARMVLEIKDSHLDVTLVCGDSRCIVTSHYSNEPHSYSEVEKWLCSIQPSSSASFVEQLRTFLDHTNSDSRLGSGASSGCKIIGVTTKL